MDQREPDLSGDYGYDLAHEVPRSEQAGVYAEPVRPGATSPAAGAAGHGQDLEYDEAHDF